MCLNEIYLLEVAITIKDTFPKSSAKEIKGVFQSIFLGVSICQLTEERSTGLQRIRTVRDCGRCRGQISENESNMFGNLHSIVRINRFFLSRTFLECL